MTSGRVYTGVHLEANVGRVAVCAEAVALGRAVIEGDETVDTIVAVHHPAPEAEDQTVRVVAPCGICRELIADYGPSAQVMVVYARRTRQALHPRTPAGEVHPPALMLFAHPWTAREAESLSAAHLS